MMLEMYRQYGYVQTYTLTNENRWKEMNDMYIT